MKRVKLVLHKPSGEAFIGWLGKYAQHTGQRWEASGGVTVLVEQDTMLDEWLYSEALVPLPD